MRIGFVLGREGFAAVLYARTTEDARTRSPWTPDIALAHAFGNAWAQRLGIPLDVVQVATTFLKE